MKLFDDKPIEGFIVGVPWTIRRRVINIPSGQTIKEAWFTVKANIDDNDADALISKHIDALVDVATEGFIEDSGSGDQVAVLRFNITRDNNAGLQEHTTYWYDVHVLTNLDLPGAPTRGTLTVREPVRRTALV